MLYADAHFVQGQGHVICEDYAVSGQSCPDRAWAVVADGCSGSTETDIGARILAQVAHRQLAAGGVIVPELLQAAGEIRARFGAPLEALDATLGWVLCDGETASLALSGDGFWAVRRADATLEWTRLTAISGAPRYLAYDLDPGRLDGYRRMSANGRYRVTRGVRWADGSQTTAEPIEGDDPLLFKWELTLQPGDQVALFTDGLATLTDRDGEVCPVDVAAELMRIPSPTGRFALRRLRRFTRHTCPARNWSWFDDLSLGMVVRRSP